jgi:hypothetical protein
MNEFHATIEQYNEYIEIWNSEYGSLTEGMKVNKSEFCHSLTDRAKSVVLSGSTPRNKVLRTIKVVSEYAYVGCDADSDSLTRGEVAALIVNSGVSVLKQHNESSIPYLHKVINPFLTSSSA